MGFPVVLKIASEQISHKSDGRVKLVLTVPRSGSLTEVTERAAKMRPDTAIDGALSNRWFQKDAGVIIGFKRDHNLVHC